MLIERSEAAREVSLDEIGEALGTLAVTTEEIESLIARLEAEGRCVTGPSGGGGESRLRRVIAAARALSGTLGRRPNVAEIATETKLTEEEVRHALALARVMSR